jgi:hypothetical protein
MKSRKAVRTTLAALALAALAAGGGLWGYLSVYPASLDSWSRRVSRPGFSLRYRSKTSTHFVALFDAGDGRLAFCRQSRFGCPNPGRSRVGIYDDRGGNLLDPGRDVERMIRVYHLGPARWEVDDGLLIPVKPGFAGRMRVEFRAAGDATDDGAAEPELRTVIDVHVEWNARGGG